MEKHLITMEFSFNRESKDFKTQCGAVGFKGFDLSHLPQIADNIFRSIIEPQLIEREKKK